MNTKRLMTSSSLLLAAAGGVCLFMPEIPLQIFAAEAPSLNPMMQGMGALYFGYAFMNWIAKDSAIGGIYARPVSMANFVHFLVGALVLARQVYAGRFDLPLLSITGIYIIFCAAFYWLVFRATGLRP